MLIRELYITENKRISRKCIFNFFLMQKRVVLIIAGIVSISFGSYAQSKNSVDTIPYLNLNECIVYALQHQPGMLQSGLEMEIVQKTNNINLSGWLPQVYLGGDFYHYFVLPSAFTTNQANPEGPPLEVKSGIYNTLTPGLSATENIFSPNLLYAAKSAHLLVEQAKQANDSSKINTIATVSSSFYILLNTLEQIKVLKEDTAEFAKNLRDAFNQYIGGIVDKTDYLEATITLNNSKAQLKQAVENVRPQYFSLKQLMGFPPQKDFNVSFDTAQMIKEVAMDTTQPLQFKSRIEYQLLETAKSLQQQNINYYRYNFLPTLSVFYDYEYEYENNTFSNLFPQAYPYSYLGASISIPLFTGFARLEGIQRAKLQGQVIELNEINLESVIYSQYTSSLANYKSNLYDFYLLRNNVTMAKDVYGVVSLQYRQGIVPYLNVITAEDNLVSSEISYTNALFQVLLSKIDYEKAMGNITPNH
jgi:outer membrane protein TolC